MGNTCRTVVGVEFLFCVSSNHVLSVFFLIFFPCVLVLNNFHPKFPYFIPQCAPTIPVFYNCFYGFYLELFGCNIIFFQFCMLKISFLFHFICFSLFVLRVHTFHSHMSMLNLQFFLSILISFLWSLHFFSQRMYFLSR